MCRSPICPANATRIRVKAVGDLALGPRLRQGSIHAADRRRRRSTTSRVGAAVLGTGGGGDPYIGKLMAQGDAAPMRRRQICLDPMELADDELVVPSAMMGAPTVMVEKIPRGEEIVTAFKALADLSRAGRSRHHVDARRAGSTRRRRSAWPRELGIPLVDADMMGRAFPELQMCTPTLYGVTATPMAIADEKGNSAIINTIDNRWTETLARTLTIDMGCSAMIALYPMTGRQVKEACVLEHDLLARTHRRDHPRARERARATRSRRCARRRAGSSSGAARSATSQRRTETGFARGEATIEGVDEFDGRR